eukprot:8191006-Alexandrium_andersonii.AAC.1
MGTSTSPHLSRTPPSTPATTSGATPDPPAQGSDDQTLASTSGQPKFGRNVASQDCVVLCGGHELHVYL